MAQPLAVADSDPPESPEAAPAAAEPSGADRRRHTRIRMDDLGIPPPFADRREGERRQGERRQGERRQGERRSMAELRSNVAWSVASDKNGRRGPRRFKLKTSRILVLLVAAGAGTVAAYLAVVSGRPAAAPAAAVAQAAPMPTTRVLVASSAVGVGQRLTPGAVTWQEWPQGAPTSDYITADSDPKAVDDLSGAVVRSAFLAGDPIRREKLAEGTGNFLPALLDHGLRGVSVMITAESAAGGFIGPNDHVDVVLTRTYSLNDRPSVTRSETILRNVQVLALDARLGAKDTESGTAKSEAFSGQALATLAVDETGAQLIASATTMGRLSLTLRSVADSAERTAGADSPANQAIRISSPFWAQ